VSLKGFHVLLISLSSLLALVVGGWSSRAWLAGLGGLYLLMAIVSFCGAVALAVYVVWFVRSFRTRDEDDRRRRKLIRPLATVVVLWLFGSRPVPACSVCYGEAAGPMIDGARLGVWLLFGLVLAVQLAFVLFFLHLWRRSRRIQLESTPPLS
jgi:uncharacterized membrane protein